MNIIEAEKRIEIIEKQMQNIEKDCVGSASWVDFCLDSDKKYQKLKLELDKLCTAVSKARKNTQIDLEA
jgi:hypothetical protein